MKQGKDDVIKSLNQHKYQARESGSRENKLEYTNMIQIPRRKITQPLSFITMCYTHPLEKRERDIDVEYPMMLMLSTHGVALREFTPFTPTILAH